MTKKLILETMQSHKWVLRLLILFFLMAGTSACAPIGHYLWGRPTPHPATGICKPVKVPILNVHWFKDSAGAWRVMGEIENKSNLVIGSLGTGVETRTKFDRQADQGEDVTANPLDLKPGEEAPFIAWIDRTIPNFDHFEVEVADCYLAQPAQRSQVDISSDKVTVDSAGQAEVTGEVVNPGTQTVLVNGLMAAVYDSKGSMISADYAQVTPRYLAPGERGAIRVMVELPPGSGAAISSHKFFMDVLVQAAASAQTLDPAKDVQILSHYTDSGGHFHLLGQLTNSSTKPVMTALQAGIYSTANSQLLDAGQYVTWVPLSPGETLPFDINNWGTLNNLPEALSGEETNINVSVRLEPFLSWNTNTPPVKLLLLTPTQSIENDMAIFSGQVKNDSQNSITTGLVLMVIKQKADGKIVAVGNVQLPITDLVPPGAVMGYALKLPLPVGLNTGALQAEVTAFGYQP